jgi:hypothetical protein
MYPQIRYEVALFLLGDFSASQFYWLTFSKTLYVHSAHTSFEDGTECSETSVHKIKTSGNHPEEKIQNSEHGESLKSRRYEVLSFGM